MTTNSPALPWARSSSTVPRLSQIAPNVYQMLQFRRLMPATLVSSLATGPALPFSSSLGSHRVQALLHPSAGRNYPQRALFSCPPALPQFPSRKQIYGKVLSVSASSVSRGSPETDSEVVFFDGGVHFGDLLVNLIFGLTLVWLPLTLAAVFRGLFLRYRFTDLRVTVQSGLLGDDRKDFSYDVIKSVKAVPRFIGEWGDMAIELKDGTIVDIRCVPKFREIAKYIELRAGGRQKLGAPSSSSPAKEDTGKKGFS